MYRIHEIFYSIQGEGVNAGRPAIFIRFAGCNRHCSFCDTPEHIHGKSYDDHRLTEALFSLTKDSRFYDNFDFVLCGGEPTLQMTEGLVKLLHGQIDKKRHLMVETNGTKIKELPEFVLSRCHFAISPKTAQDAIDVCRALEDKKIAKFFEGEVKILSAPLYEGDDSLDKTLAIFDALPDNIELLLQPCDYGTVDKNREEIEKCVRLVKDRKIRLSLQTHKYINIP